ncbi:hypothetical protein D3C87_1795330 [compost metagenome]
MRIVDLHDDLGFALAQVFEAELELVGAQCAHLEGLVVQEHVIAQHGDRDLVGLPEGAVQDRGGGLEGI